MYETVYEETVVKSDIPKISSDWQRKIKNAIETKLTSDPVLYGKPLRKSLKNYLKLRVGDYRIIFRIERKIVKIFVIQHRSVVYKTASKRL